MNPQVIKWASGIIVLITLSGFVGSTAVRMDRVEQEAKKVAGLEKHMELVLIYLKLQDPDLYEKAVRLYNN